MNIKVFKVSFQILHNQCYLFYKNGKGILIDPAWDYQLIQDFLLENNITLKGILLTHSHVDHTNLAQQFSEEYHIPVFMSAVEIDDYQFKLPDLKEVYHLQEFKVDDFTITPLHTPGHTSGSICYLVDHHLFSGDTVFIEGVGICAGKNSCPDKMYDSVQFLKKYLSQDTVIWPGHSFGQTPGKTLSFLLQNNIYFQFTNKTHFVNFRMRKNQSNIFKFAK